MAKQLPLEPAQKTTLRIPEHLHRRVKVRAAEEGRHMSELVARTIEEYLARGVAQDSKKPDR